MTHEKTTIVHHLDAEGLKCPLPVLRLQKKLEGLKPGEVVRVTATDENTALDIPAVCRADGHEVRHTGREGAVLIFEVVKGAGPSTAD